MCDGVPLAEIAAQTATPVYVYSAALLCERYRAIDEAFGGYPHALHYALKANSSLALVKLLRGLGSAADANSIWEIELALKAGWDAVHARLGITAWFYDRFTSAISTRDFALRRRDLDRALDFLAVLRP